VIATASGANTDFVRSLGADQVVDYTSTRFEDAVRDVDLVLDTIGGEVMQRSMQVVKRGGRLITLLGIPPSEEDAQTRGIIAMNNTGRLTRSTFETIGALIADGTVRVSVGARFSLHEVRQAHALVETGHGSGRVVLEVI
jgi:NADPH:quinone reductase-like Zn-dependent oxidoreductase